MGPHEKAQWGWEQQLPLNFVHILHLCECVRTVYASVHNPRLYQMGGLCSKTSFWNDDLFHSSSLNDIKDAKGNERMYLNPNVLASKHTWFHVNWTFNSYSSSLRGNLSNRDHISSSSSHNFHPYLSVYTFLPSMNREGQMWNFDSSFSGLKAPKDQLSLVEHDATIGSVSTHNMWHWQTPPIQWHFPCPIPKLEDQYQLKKEGNVKGGANGKSN